MDSREPWGFFLGRAAHKVIGRQYRAERPNNLVLLDPNDLFTIVKEGKLGDPERLPVFVRSLRPDITDIRDSVLFEIKPDNGWGLTQGREQSQRYLTVLNSVATSDKKLNGGTGFEGALFIEFENGGFLWKLSWRTPEPGVTLYRWSRLDKKEGASLTERMAQKEEALSLKEAEQRGEMVEQALLSTYGDGEWPDKFEGQVYRPVDCH